MPKIVMFTYDDRLDRRAVLECNSLIARGYDVTLYAVPYEDESADPAYVRRIDKVKPYKKISGTSLYAFVRKCRKWLENRFPFLATILLPIARYVFWHVYLYLPTIQWEISDNGKRRVLVRRGPESLFLEVFETVLALEAKADLYIAADLPMLPVALEAKKRYGGKILYDSHELFPEQEFTKKEQEAWRKLETRIIGNADAVIAVNPSAINLMKERYQLKNANYIYNAEFIPESGIKKMRRFHEMLSLPEDARIVLYQGGFSHQRNLDGLVASMSHIQDPSIHLVFLGSGAMERTLKSLTKDLCLEKRVHFMETVPQSVLLEYTSSADLGVIPYQNTCLNNYYCTPNKLFEFIAAGLPFIGTNLPEIHSIVHKHQIGLTGNTGDPQALAELITHAMEPSKLASFRENILKAREAVNWQHEGERFVQIVEELAPPKQVKQPQGIRA